MPFLMQFLMILCFVSTVANCSSLQIPLAMRIEARPVLTNAYLVMDATVINATLSDRLTSGTEVQRKFATFLSEVAGPNSQKAIGSITKPAAGSDALPPEALIRLYQNILKKPARRILFSVDLGDRTIFVWQSAQINGESPTVVTTAVQNGPEAFRVSAPHSDDNISYLVLRSMQLASESGQLDRIMSTTNSAISNSSYRLFQITPKVQLAVKMSIFESAMPLPCADARTSSPGTLVACWMTDSSLSNRLLAWLSAESRSRATQWLASLSPTAKVTLSQLSPGSNFKAVIFEVGPLAVVFPSMLSPFLGNKRSVYVNTSVNPSTIVNFFSADFADAVLTAAYEKAVKETSK